MYIIMLSVTLKIAKISLMKFSNTKITHITIEA